MRDFLVKQFDDKFLWVPIILAFGAGLYFTLPNEPNILTHIIVCVLCLVFLLFGKRNFLWSFAGIFCGGFLYAIFYTHFIVHTPILTHDLRNQEITATVTDIDFTDDKVRLMLSVPGDDLRIKNAKRANIRVSINNDVPIPNIGDEIRAKVSVFAPSPMEAPESFDYARWAFFNNLTATGFITEYEITKHNDTNNINTVRNIIHNTANSFLTDGLVLGYKNSVPENDKQIWTTAGIGHIWSISGFHMTLIGGWLFAIFYLICRSIGFITKRIPARIVATICAWIILTAYVFISGASVATLRAFLMTSLLFLALLVGRNAVSMRNICIAFLILFICNPHVVTQVGFQLSFAAIFGLIWFFNDKKFDNKFTFIEKAKGWIYAAIMTSVIASLFTLPFIATHFDYVPLYSLIGNLVLVPVFSIIIMPLVVIGTICALFGGHLMLRLAMYVYDYSLYIAQKITELPASNITMPHIPDVAFIMFIIGFVFLVLIKTIKDSGNLFYKYANYILFIVCICIGTIIVITHPKPVFYITPDHELIGMVFDGKLKFNKARASNHYFAFDTFRKLNGEPHSDKNIRHKCPDGVCIYKSDDFTVAYIQKFLPLKKHLVDLCWDDSINFIVSYFDISGPKCNHKILQNGFVIYKSGVIKYTPVNRWWHNPHE